MPTNPSRLHPWISFALGGVAVLAAAGVSQALLWPRPAIGQVPDSGLQRKEMIDELRLSNKKLTEIAGLLREIRDQQAARKEPTPPKAP